MGGRYWYMVKSKRTGPYGTDYATQGYPTQTDNLDINDFYFLAVNKGRPISEGSFTVYPIATLVVRAAAA